MKKTGTGAAVKRERVPQAERRRITRGKLLDATIDSLIEDGYSRTTTVAVGERTEMKRSPGNIGHSVAVHAFAGVDPHQGAGGSPMLHFVLHPNLCLALGSSRG